MTRSVLPAVGGICVLDVDTSDERIFADALSEFGATPFHVRSGSGNWQAWYRNTGLEGRRVRPDPSRPMDVLGNGFVVAPPSRVTKGTYEIVSGSLDVLPHLPPIQGSSAPTTQQSIAQ